MTFKKWVKNVQTVGYNGIYQFSFTTKVMLLQRQQQQQQYPNNHYESSENNQTELHRFGQNADRFTTSGGTNITTVRSDFFSIFSCHSKGGQLQKLVLC